MTTLAAPRTAAGRALLTSLENINTRAYNPTLAGDILAIEAEAAEAVAASMAVNTPAPTIARLAAEAALPAEPAGATDKNECATCGKRRQNWTHIKRDGHPFVPAPSPAEPAPGLRCDCEGAAYNDLHYPDCPTHDAEPAGAGLRVRILIQGGLVKDMYPGSAWRVERIDSLYKPSGIVGEDAAESTVIDFAALAATPVAALDVERLARALHEGSLDNGEHLCPKHHMPYILCPAAPHERHAIAIAKAYEGEE